MKRLTKYDEFGNAELVGIDNTKLYERLVCDETVALTTAIDKLGKLEDALEEFELTSAEDLRNYLNFKGNMAIWEGELNYKNKIADLEQENQQLKQSQKQLAISELRRIKEYILINDEYDEEAGCNIIETFDLIEDIIDRIEKLGGGENE